MKHVLPWLVITNKFDSKCFICFQSLKATTKIYYNVETKTPKCFKCPFPGNAVEVVEHPDIPTVSEAVKLPDYERFGTTTPSKRYH